MLHHVKIHREEPGLQRGAERVPLHEANLCIGRLVSEQVLLRWHHILEDLGGGKEEALLTSHPSEGTHCSPQYSETIHLKTVRCKLHCPLVREGRVCSMP